MSNQLIPVFNGIINQELTQLVAITKILVIGLFIKNLTLLVEDVI